MSISRRFFLLEYTVESPGNDSDPTERHRRLLSLSDKEAKALPGYIANLDPEELLTWQITPVLSLSDTRAELAAEIAGAK